MSEVSSPKSCLLYSCIGPMSLLHHTPLKRPPRLTIKLSNALFSNFQQWVHYGQKNRNGCSITKVIPPPWSWFMGQGRSPDSSWAILRPFSRNLKLRLGKTGCSKGLDLQCIGLGVVTGHICHVGWVVKETVLQGQRNRTLPCREKQRWEMKKYFLGFW